LKCRQHRECLIPLVGQGTRLAHFAGHLEMSLVSKLAPANFAELHAVRHRILQSSTPINAITWAVNPYRYWLTLREVVACRQWTFIRVDENKLFPAQGNNFAHPHPFR